MWLGWGQTEYTFSQNQNIKTLVYRLNLLKIWTLSKLVVLTLWYTKELWTAKMFILVEVCKKIDGPMYTYARMFGVNEAT